MSELVMVPVTNIYPHPDNPRKELGDLQELSNSIKANGVLQNLTIVPIEGRDGEYTAIIGHRRLAAAKLAGLRTVPCVVAEMDYKTQLHTMLTENMQRSDLTVYEQAEGFQMMLDLGETMGSIADKTGFSESTIRRRVKLLDLDKAKFKKASDRGASLQDYAELDKIEDPQLKNEVLEHIGTNNFRHRLQLAIEKEKDSRAMAEIIDAVDVWAFEITAKEVSDKKLIFAGNIYIWNMSSQRETMLHGFKDADKVRHYYVRQSNGVMIYRDPPQKTGEDVLAEAAAAEAKARWQEQLAELEAASESAYLLRKAFIYNLPRSVAREHMADITEFAVEQMMNRYGQVDDEDLCEALGIDYCDGYDFGEMSREIMSCPEKVLLVSAYLLSDDSPSRHYHGYGNEALRFCPNDQLDELYCFLEDLGYEMSDAERQLMDGVHELFEKEA